MAKPLYVGTLVSRDAKWGAIMAEMQLASTDPIDKLRYDPDKRRRHRQCLPAGFRQQTERNSGATGVPGIEFLHTGDVPMELHLQHDHRATISSSSPC